MAGQKEDVAWVGRGVVRRRRRVGRRGTRRSILRDWWDGWTDG